MFQPGDTLNYGSYRIIKELGRGGLGVVYLAEDLRLRQQVAIKTILPEIAASRSRAVEVFYEEARNTASLDHPHIIRMHFTGEREIQGRLFPYIVMQYMDGGDLEVALERGPWDLRKILRWMYQIADGLAYAHQEGVIHRDLKPQNIFLTKNQTIKIGDFGLAKAKGSETRTMLKGGGTPAYISPEQAEGRSGDFLSDIYSLGVVYYQMLTGQVPYDTVYGHVHGPIPSVRAVKPGLPRALDQLIQWMMAKDPAHRPNSVDEVARKIAAILNTMRDPPARKIGRWLVIGSVVLSLTTFLVMHRFAPALLPPIPFVWLEEMIQEVVDRWRTPHEAKPDILLTREEVEKPLRLYEQHCARIAIDSFEPQSRVIALQGRVQSERQKADIRMEVQKILEGFQINDEKLEIIPPPFCTVLEILEPFKNAALNMILNKATPEGRPTYYQNEHLVVHVTTPPDRISYVYVDNFTTDANVTHMFPNFLENMRPFAPATSYTVGEPNNPNRMEFRIKPPAGIELVTLIVSERQLFPVPRPLRESAAAYLRELRQVLAHEISQSDAAAMFHFFINQSE